jgi:hypothetical protein
MKKLPKWLVHLFPSRDLSFRQRFIGILFTWGLPIIIWEVIQSGVHRAPAHSPFFLALQLVATLVGVTFYAMIEHVCLISARKRENRKS